MTLFLVEAGFVGFLVALVGAIWRGLGRDGHMRRSFYLWLGAAVLCFVVWAIGLRLHPVPWPQ